MDKSISNHNCAQRIVPMRFRIFALALNVYLSIIHSYTIDDVHLYTRKTDTAHFIWMCNKAKSNITCVERTSSISAMIIECLHDNWFRICDTSVSLPWCSANWNKKNLLTPNKYQNTNVGARRSFIRFLSLCKCSWVLQMLDYATIRLLSSTWNWYSILHNSYSYLFYWHIS